jgi:hypothetical protein
VGTAFDILFVPNTFTRGLGILDATNHTRPRRRFIVDYLKGYKVLVVCINLIILVHSVLPGRSR